MLKFTRHSCLHVPRQIQTNLGRTWKILRKWEITHYCTISLKYCPLQKTVKWQRNKFELEKYKIFITSSFQEKVQVFTFPKIHKTFSSCLSPRLPLKPEEKKIIFSDHRYIFLYQKTGNSI